MPQAAGKGKGDVRNLWDHVPSLVRCTLPTVPACWPLLCTAVHAVACPDPVLPPPLLLLQAASCFCLTAACAASSAATGTTGARSQMARRSGRRMRSLRVGVGLAVHAPWLASELWLAASELGKSIGMAWKRYDP